MIEERLKLSIVPGEMSEKLSNNRIPQIVYQGYLMYKDMKIHMVIA